MAPDTEDHELFAELTLNELDRLLKLLLERPSELDAAIVLGLTLGVPEDLYVGFAQLRGWIIEKVKRAGHGQTTVLCEPFFAEPFSIRARVRPLERLGNLADEPPPALADCHVEGRVLEAVEGALIQEPTKLGSNE